MPENKSLKIILEKARSGVLFTGRLTETIAGLIEKLRQVGGPQRIKVLMECLLAIAHSDEWLILLSISFQENLSESENE